MGRSEGNKIGMGVKDANGEFIHIPFFNILDFRLSCNGKVIHDLSANNDGLTA